MLPNELKVGFAKISITPDLIDKWEDIDNDAQFNSNIDLWTDVNGNGHIADGSYGSAGVYSQAVMTGSDFDADMEAQDYDTFEEFKI